MNVLILGSGRVGTAFGYLLKERGYRILGVYNRHRETGLRALERIGEGTVYDRESLPAAVPVADLIIITTPDRAIKETAALAGGCSPRNDAYLMHMSGLLDSEILKISGWEGGVFSFHPLQAIAGFTEGVRLLPEALFTVEGDEKGEKFAGELARSLGLKYLVIKKEYKPLYHAAAVVASNYLVTLVDSSFRLLKKAGMDREEVKKGLLQLVKGTLQNLDQMTPAGALTGPIARGDLETIDRHRQALADYAPEIGELYRLLGWYTAEMIGNEEIKRY
ncbi:MAG: DUF2520 domain-containing protein, partial [Firmicutes bacterium]|nr:DUF2520 domain-containing protein [Bacillota bacterium]